MAKQKTVEQVEFTSSKRGKLRDAKATQNLSLALAFARNKRLAGK